MGYIEYTMPICNVETSIRILETPSDLFIYVNQFPDEIHLYNDALKDIICANCAYIKSKKIEIICNLAMHESLESVASNITEILNSE